MRLQELVVLKNLECFLSMSLQIAGGGGRGHSLF